MLYSTTSVYMPFITCYPPFGWHRCCILTINVFGHNIWMRNFQKRSICEDAAGAAVCSRARDFAVRSKILAAVLKNMVLIFIPFFKPFL
jgi:hypothetical protein